MRALDWSDLALTDLLSILDYIADENPTAAQALKDEIDAKAARLPVMPGIGRPGRVDGTRELVVRPNFLLVYRHDEARVTILRVLHAAQMWP